MAASRLNDSQKQEVVLRYQAGETAAALAEAFSCSANTVSRTIKAAIGLEAYGAIKDLRIAGSAAKAIGKPEIAQDQVELELIPPAAFAVTSEEDDYEKEEIEIN